MPRSNRSGAETRAAVQRAALRLFSERGYEATSLRDIAAEVGINKASLYYYFPSKEDILRSVLEARSTEARDLMTWLEHEPRTPDLAERAVLRWVDAFTAEKLHGIRFMNGNPRVFRALAATTGVDLGDELAGLLRFFGDAEPEQQVLLRMAFLSIGTAVAAAEGVADATDEVAIRAARSAARALIAAARAS